MTTSKAPASQNFFNQEVAEAYDQRNSGLSPISACLHFLTQLALAKLPDNAHVLCVGVGTGAEILSLAQARPQWSFVGIDPSAEMLNVGRLRLERAGIIERCDLRMGYVQDAPEGPFDAVVSLLVAHFITRAERPGFYRAINDRLKPGGRFLSAEISSDMDAAEFPLMLEDWKQVQILMGRRRNHWRSSTA